MKTTLNCKKLLGKITAFTGLTIASLPSMAGTTCLNQGLSAYENGNYTHAANILNICAQQGNAKAQLTLGTLYSVGLGVDKSEHEALVWYSKAAKQGLPEAQFNMGMIYANGIGVTVDDDKALDWIYAAASQGYEQAEFVFNAMINEDFTAGC